MCYKFHEYELFEIKFEYHKKKERKSISRYNHDSFITLNFTNVNEIRGICISILHS